MKLSEAAKLIGCSMRHVRTLIQCGKLQATVVSVSPLRSEYQISEKEAVRYRDHHGDGRGWPRGKPRKY